MQNKTILLSILSFFLFAFVNIANAQNANIRGFVYEKESGEPVIFNSVILAGTTIGVQTDVNGYFSMTKVPPGTYNLTITFLGHDTLKESITVKAGEIYSHKFYMQKSSVKLKELEISAERKELQTEVHTSITKITPKDMKRLPSVGGEPDLAQYLQVIPGVVSTGDQGGQLYIRGGSPVQNKVLLDGMIIYNPFHSIGLFSVFDADYIRNADVYTGGFGAEYGGRISSIMDITTRDGNKKRVSGKVSTTTFGAKTLLEGPLKKSEDDGGGSSSFLISAKNSYLQQTSKVLYPYVDSGKGLPFNFVDLYGKLSFNTANGSKVNLFGFDFADHVNYAGVSDLKWKSYGGGGNFIVVPGGSQVLIKGNFAYSKYGIDLTEGTGLPRHSDINGFNMGLNFTYFIRKSELNYGIEVLGYKTNFDFYNLNYHVTQQESTSELAGYVRYKIVVGKLIIDPSFRLQNYASLSEISPEPRIGFKYNVTDKFRLKASAGMYSQNLIAANSDRDVVNLFYGFLSGPDNLPKTTVAPNGTVNDVTSRLQKADHFIAGFEYDLSTRWSVNVEGYDKEFRQLTNFNRNKIFDDVADNSSKPDSLKKDFIIESGYARGIDFQFKYDYKKLYLWLVYSIGYVKRWDGEQWYAPHFDRRHNVNLVASYTFGKGLNWEVDARWNFGSGFPFTQTQGFYPKPIPGQNVGSNYTTANSSLGIIYGPLNGARLPTYHRLDISIKRKFAISTNSILEATAGLTNVYDRQNVFYTDRLNSNIVIYQLPVLPSVGVNLTF